MTDEPVTEGPSCAQFKVLAPETGMGAKVLFNGQEIQGVTAVEFKNRVDCEEVTRCSITIELMAQVIESENIAPPIDGDQKVPASGGTVISSEPHSEFKNGVRAYRDARS